MKRELLAILFVEACLDGDVAVVSMSVSDVIGMLATDMLFQLEIFQERVLSMMRSQCLAASAIPIYMLSDTGIQLQSIILAST